MGGRRGRMEDRWVGRAARVRDWGEVKGSLGRDVMH